MTLPVRLRAARREHKLTLRQLAELTTLHVMTLSRVERGLTPTVDQIARLSVALQVPAAELAGLAVHDRLRALGAPEAASC